MAKPWEQYQKKPWEKYQKEEEVAPVQPEIPAQPEKEPTIMENIESSAREIPGFSEAAEFAAGANRGILGFVDFLGPDTVNAILSLGGAEYRVPTLVESIPGTKGGFVEPGLKRDILGAAGETSALALGAGQALRQVASKLPQQFAGESVKRGVLREVGKVTPAQDVGFGALAGAGFELGEEVGGETGALVGSIVTPTAATLGTQALRSLVNMGAKGITALTKSLAQMSEEKASKLLAEAMKREGMNEEEVIAKMAQLGPEGIPADIGESFSRLLRSASSEVPRISGVAKNVLGERQAGQAERISTALEEATTTRGLNATDEIESLNRLYRPEIDDAYALARQEGEKALFPEKPRLPVGVGPAKGKGKPAPEVVKPKKTKLERLLAGEAISGGAKRAADKEIQAKMLAGEQVTKIDIIDANKRALDDIIGAAIRAGKDNKARLNVKLKNILIEETDKLVPSYKKARDVFAGKVELENAVSTGENFFKMKNRDILEYTKNMGESERQFFKLGAKQAILDKVETMPITADTVKRLFGKNGDVKKLRMLFDNKSKFDKFSEVLEREANFIVTKRAAQGNSTTQMQLSEVQKTKDIVNGVAAFAVDPAQGALQAKRILQGLFTEKGSMTHVKALEEAGEILLEKGISPDLLIKVIKRGKAEEVKELMDIAFGKSARAAKTAQEKIAKGEAIVGAQIEDTPKNGNGNK